MGVATKMTTKMTIVIALVTKTDALAHSIKFNSDCTPTGQEYHEGFIPDRKSLGEEIILLIIQRQEG
jgi:hypothetical protein